MKLKTLTVATAALFTTGAMAASTSVYLEQQVDSNATKEGVYATEVGANINTSENGNVFIGMDDQGWLAAGYGHDFSITDQWDMNLYGEVGKWDEAEEAFLEATVIYQAHSNFNVFGGLGYNRSSITDSAYSDIDSDIGTGSIYAGTHMNFGQVFIDYKYTYEQVEGISDLSQEDYSTHEHEVIMGMSFDDWTPYVKYTYYDNNGVFDGATIESDSIWTLGIAYQF
ncbi:hypothetical protein [Vibrio ulleungensis]|uniref:Porin n=1 Tax=Vibrio ulleungensis TaxID=2807619 RepID=A0ABS2HJ60_9VIBR|nr:hypothetical protein [Vibrio ulleungensis]MBM7037054.1 hypothetical protein [Vibrio ulleungensis]